MMFIRDGCDRATSNHRRKRSMRSSEDQVSFGDQKNAAADTGAWLALRQMLAVLNKNFLLKIADWRQTIAEVRSWIFCGTLESKRYIVGRGGGVQAIIGWRWNSVVFS